MQTIFPLENLPILITLSRRHEEFVYIGRHDEWGIMGRSVGVIHFFHLLLQIRFMFLKVLSNYLNKLFKYELFVLQAQYYE